MYLFHIVYFDQGFSSPSCSQIYYTPPPSNQIHSLSFSRSLENWQATKNKTNTQTEKKSAKEKAQGIHADTETHTQSHTEKPHIIKNKKLQYA